MLKEGTNWKAVAVQARGNCDMMIAVCKDITLSSQAADQIEAAKAACRSLFTLRHKHSPARAEVAEIRYERLIGLL